MIEPPALQVPAHAELVLARPPFSLDEERALLRDKEIDIVVSKNSGGDSTLNKLIAAREAGLPVIMIERPAKPAAVTASCVEEVITLVGEQLT
jgi:precorrin-6A/cobalt-precorrin-6A reductase